MERRLTDGTRRVIQQAADEARRLTHLTVGPEHLLLALLGAPEATAARRVLRQHECARAGLEAAVEPGTTTVGAPPLNAAAQQCFDIALREARALGSHLVTEDHLLLGIIQADDGIARRWLVDHGLDVDELRTAVAAVEVPPPSPTRRLSRGTATSEEIHAPPVEEDLDPHE